MNFFHELLRAPKSTGAVGPSSKSLVESMARNARLEEAKAVVELGPGTGVFTARILKSIGVKTPFFCIEINRAFADETKRQHPEVDVYFDSAEHIQKYLKLHGLKHCDRIISSLPWTIFEPALQDTLLDSIYEALEPGGLFLTFAHVPMNHFPGGKMFKEKLRERFREVKETRVVYNIPPAFFYVCKK